MCKHVLGQSIYQLIILFVFLFHGPSFLQEDDPAFIRYGFALKYCFNAPVLISPDFNSSSIQNPDQYLKTTQQTVYLISGMKSSFANSTIVNVSNNTFCNIQFDGMNTMTEAYNYFNTVRNLIII